MKLKNAELKNVADSILLLRTERLNVKTALAITANVNILNKAGAAYEEKRIGILDSYALKGEDGKALFAIEDFVNNNGEKQSGSSYQFETPELKAECIDKINELMNTEVEIEFKQITQADILNESRLSPDQVGTLLIFTKEE